MSGVRGDIIVAVEACCSQGREYCDMVSKQCIYHSVEIGIVLAMVSAVSGV